MGSLFCRPELHCFSSSLTAVCAPNPTQAVIFLGPTAKSLPSPATFRKAATSLQSTINKDESDAERARSFLRGIFYEIGFWSKLYCEVHNSAFLDQHINRIADSLGTGRLLMYVQVWNHWACWCQCHSYPPAEAPLSLVLDYLHASDFRSFQTKEGFQTFKKNQNDDPYQSATLGGSKIGPSCTHSLTESNSCRFPEISNSCRFPEISNPNPVWTIGSYTYSTCSFSSLGTKDTFRWLISTWDHCTWLFSYCNNGFSRSRDLLRTKPETLSIQGHILRGISWRTKTSVSGLGSLLSRHYHSSFCEALTKVVITGAPTGHQISFSPHGPTQSPSLHLVLTITLLLWFDFTPNAIGSHRRYWLPNSPHTVWNRLYLQLLDNSTLTWNNVANKDITKNQSNRIHVMMFGL